MLFFMSTIDKIIPVSIALPQCDVLIKPASQEFNLVSKSQSETEMNVEVLHETAPKKKISTKDISPFYKVSILGVKLLLPFCAWLFLGCKKHTYLSYITLQSTKFHHSWKFCIKIP